MKRALITGITGQDGSYLTELLLQKGYQVHGLVRPDGQSDTRRIDRLLTDPAVFDERLFLHEADLTDSTGLTDILDKVSPAEIYHLAARSQPSTSFENPEELCNLNALGTVRLLDAIVKSKQQIRFYQASSSEIFGHATASPQNEKTPFHPRNPYGSSKAFAHWLTSNYRETYSLHASNGICFNHESPRRSDLFVSRKITRGLAKILVKKQEVLQLGNLDAVRDWGYAKDYVEAMWMMLQADEGDDYVVATGAMHSVHDFLDEAFRLVGLDWHDHVRVDQKHYRPAETSPLIGDASKIREKLGWSPKTDFARLVYIMVDADLRLEGMSLSEFSDSGRKAA